MDDGAPLYYNSNSLKRSTCNILLVVAYEEEGCRWPRAFCHKTREFNSSLLVLIILLLVGMLSHIYIRTSMRFLFLLWGVWSSHQHFKIENRDLPNEKKVDTRPQHLKKSNSFGVKKNSFS